MPRAECWHDWRYRVSDLHDLLGAMRRAPKLADAACRGMWAVFDPAEHGEDPADTADRHHGAITLCRSCPALDACEQWFNDLPPRLRPIGVVAGRIHEPKPRASRSTTHRNGKRGGQTKTTRTKPLTRKDKND